MLIYVFGSNLAGRHGKGSALTAKEVYGAEPGVGEGRTGRSYAIPTKDHYLQVRRLPDILSSILKFIDYAKATPDLDFMVSRVGCMNAGYEDFQIAPYFSSAPPNCILPQGWRELYSEKYDFKVSEI